MYTISLPYTGTAWGNRVVRLPIKYIIHVNKLRLWNSLLNIPHERLTKQILLGMYYSNETNWGKELCNIFS